MSSTKPMAAQQASRRTRRMRRARVSLAGCRRLASTTRQAPTRGKTAPLIRLRPSPLLPGRLQQRHRPGAGEGGGEVDPEHPEACPVEEMGLITTVATAAAELFGELGRLHGSHERRKRKDAIGEGPRQQTIVVIPIHRRRDRANSGSWLPQRAPGRVRPSRDPFTRQRSHGAVPHPLPDPAAGAGGVAEEAAAGHRVALAPGGQPRPAGPGAGRRGVHGLLPVLRVPDPAGGGAGQPACGGTTCWRPPAPGSAIP